MPHRTIFGNYDLVAANVWEQLPSVGSMTDGVVLKARSTNPTWVDICSPADGSDPNVSAPAANTIARLEAGDAPSLPVPVLKGLWVRSTDATCVLDIFGASAY